MVSLYGPSGGSNKGKMGVYWRAPDIGTKGYFMLKKVIKVKTGEKAKEIVKVKLYV